MPIAANAAASCAALGGRLQQAALRLRQKAVPQLHGMHHQRTDCSQSPVSSSTALLGVACRTARGRCKWHKCSASAALPLPQ